MTIEEAIKYIDVGWSDGSGGIYIGREYSWKYKEAVNVAIAALRAQQEAESKSLTASLHWL